MASNERYAGRGTGGGTVCREGFNRPGRGIQVSIFPVRAQPLLRSAVGIVGEFPV